MKTVFIFLYRIQQSFKTLLWCWWQCHVMTWLTSSWFKAKAPAYSRRRKVLILYLQAVYRTKTTYLQLNL